jgi:hypothetical protein
MQTKLISQTGLKVRTNCRLGYYRFDPAKLGRPLTPAESGNNKCIGIRDKYVFECTVQFWPQDGVMCRGNIIGKLLDRCMATVWEPEDLNTYRSQGGTPYNSSLGDKCFNEFYDRYKNQGWAIGDNKAEWEKCLKTVP